MAANPAPAPLGLLVKTWPKLSETFILEEVLGLERQGIALRLYALGEPTDAFAHAAVARVQAPLARVPQAAAVRDCLAEHARVAAAAPLRYLATLASALGRGRAGWRQFLRAGALAAQMQRDGVGHLHAHFIAEPADIAQLASRLAGIPFSISAHAKDIYLSAPRDLSRRLRAARFTVTCTEANRQALAALAPEATLHRMYHGIDNEVFHPQRRAAAAGDDRPLLLAVGRLRAKKGLDTLIDAVRLLHERGQRVQLEIVGYGEEQDALAQRIANAGLGQHVRLAGKLPREQVLERYARAALFVQPSRIAADGDRDGIPNVLLEAMAMGLPVVATRVSGIPEVIDDGINGLLVEPDAPLALADAIERALREPALAAGMAAAARRTVTGSFDNDQNLRVLTRLLEMHSPEAAAPLPPAGAASGLAKPVPRRPLGKNTGRIEAGEPRVAYVMNGFPRLSETFIAHEIHQLERLGLGLRLYTVKDEREPVVHAVVSAIRAPRAYLPEASSLSGTTLWRWLRDNVAAFWPAHRALLQQRPLAWLSTAAGAAALAWKHGPSPLTLRKVFIKEFLQAGWIADAALREGDVAHLHGHFCHGVATITWFASRLSGLPYSFTAHAKDIYQRELNPGRLLESKLGAARFVATCTCANAQVLRARHPRPDEVHTIYHGLDTDWFSPHAAAATDEPPLVLAVGRLVEKKGFDQLVAACALLKARGVALRCRIVGEDGSAGAALRAQIHSLGVSDMVQLQGAMPQDALREVYRGARAFALPCRVMEDGDRDGFPNVLAEAMAMGVPVVSTPISGIPEMIDDGVHGLLVDGSAQALADAVERLLADAALHERLAVAARKRICERFDSRRTTVALRDLFARELARRQGARLDAQARSAQAAG